MPLYLDVHTIDVGVRAAVHRAAHGLKAEESCEVREAS